MMVKQLTALAGRKSALRCNTRMSKTSPAMKPAPFSAAINSMCWKRLISFKIARLCSIIEEEFRHSERGRGILKQYRRFLGYARNDVCSITSVFETYKTL